MGIVVLAHGRFRRGIGDRRLRTGHEDPLFKVFVVSDLDLVTFEAAFVEHGGLSNVAYVDDVALLHQVAAAANRHHLHFAAAMLPGNEMREKLHVVNVHAAVEIRDAVGSRVAVMVTPCGKGRASQGETCAGGLAEELAAGGPRGAFVWRKVAAALEDLRAQLVAAMASAHRREAPRMAGWRNQGPAKKV